MKNREIIPTSNTETLTISRAEYERLQAQSERISELESRVDMLLEALRLARHKQFGASSEKSVIPGSFATPEAIAYIMTQKFVMGSPLCRQEKELNRQGVQLSRQTMSDWILRASEEYLTPVYEQPHRNPHWVRRFTI